MLQASRHIMHLCGLPGLPMCSGYLWQKKISHMWTQNALMGSSFLLPQGSTFLWVCYYTLKWRHICIKTHTVTEHPQNIYRIYIYVYRQRGVRECVRERGRLFSLHTLLCNSDWFIQCIPTEYHLLWSYQTQQILCQKRNTVPNSSAVP